MIPDTPITNGKTIIEDYHNNKNYEIPFSTNENGEILLGEAVEVKRKVTYEAIKIGAFVKKDDKKREVTGPVMLPGCPDCDFKRGEKIFTIDEVAAFCHEFNTKYRLSDEMHLYGATGEIIGESVENWTLKEELVTKNITGEEVVLPVGTWMSTVKITDDTTWTKVEDGTYRGFSGTYLSEKDAEVLLDSLTVNKHENVLSNLFSANKRVLIKDLDNPVPVTISIVDTPCVPNAIFTSVKNDKRFFSVKAGRRFSDAVYNKLKDAKTVIDNFIKEAENERQTPDNEGSGKILEVDDMDEKELATLIEGIIDKKIKPLSDEIDLIKGELESTKGDKNDPIVPVKCSECDHELDESVKFCPECGDHIQTKEDKKTTPTIKFEENPVIKGIIDTQKLIVEKLGIEPESNNLDGQTDDDSAGKSDTDFYKEAGLKRNGRPLQE
ncbi:MAG: XkdF-like putative serine protease domain-containing protein [Methanobacteriaceae archaeon]|nr:XkdF-like putative serine protease domain-containing protein [Methanobacteriaceae archaeon]